MIDEPVALKWSHAPVTLQNEIRSHWRRSHFTDISLVCDGNVEIRAHQVLLSSCSPFIKKLLLENEMFFVQQPNIVLSGVSEVQMKTLLSFLYRGTVTLEKCDEKDFNSVLKLLEIDIDKSGTYGEKHKLNIKPSTIEVKKESPLSDDEDEEGGKDADFEYEPYANDSSDDDDETPSTNSDKNSRDDQVTATIIPIIQKPVILNEATRKCIEKKARPPPRVKDAKYNRECYEKYQKKGKYICPQCGIICTMKKTLKSHVLNVHQKVRYPCDQCSHQAATKFRLKEHILAEHEGKRYYCDQCSYAAPTQGYLAGHIRNNHGEREPVLYKCDVDGCKYQSKQKVNLKKHKEAIHMKIKYSCTLCPSQWSQEGHMKKHMMKKHGIDASKYQKFCSKG